MSNGFHGDGATEAMGGRVRQRQSEWWWSTGQNGEWFVGDRSGVAANPATYAYRDREQEAA